MATVGVDSGSLQADSQPKSSGLVLGQRPLILSSNEPGELSQWLCHDDSSSKHYHAFHLYGVNK